MDQKILKIIRNKQYFLKFTNYYKIFVKNFFQVAAPLICITCKDKIEQSKQVETSFEALKTSFIFAPILYYLDFFKIFFIEIDILDFAIGDVLLQIRANDKLYLLAFYCKNFFAMKFNYENHDKELIILDLFEEWCHYLKSTLNPLIIYINYKSLKYFISTHILNYHYAHWNMSLSRFNFKITY